MGLELHVDHEPSFPGPFLIIHLSHVCHHWRDLVFHTPTLWNLFHLPGRVHRARIRRGEGRARAAHEGAQQRVEQGERPGERDLPRVHRDRHVRPSFLPCCVSSPYRMRLVTVVIAVIACHA